MPKYKPCHRNPKDEGEQERYVYCSTLRSLSDSYDRPKAKGIFINEYVNMKFEQTRTYVVAKLGEHLKKGIVFNFCPFCGEKLIEKD